MLFLLCLLVQLCWDSGVVAMEGCKKQLPADSRSEYYEEETCSGHLVKLVKSNATYSAILGTIKRVPATINYVFDNTTALHAAVGLGKQDLVKLLVSHGAEVNKEAGADQLTPLKKAIRMHDYGMVVLLIELGASINREACHCELPLYVAVDKYEFCSDYKKSAINETFGIIQLLLEKGAKITWPQKLNSYQAERKNKFTNIMQEAQKSIAAQKQIIVYRTSEDILFGFNKN
jgi:hypothetical protein